MNIRKQVHILAVAAVLAAATLSLLSVQAQAKSVSGGGSGCGVINPATGAVETYPAGTKYVDQNGRKYVCGADGWFHLVNAIIAGSDPQNPSPRTDIAEAP